MNGVILKVVKDENIPKYIAIIRKATGKSIGQIKEDIELGKPILSTEKYKLTELELILDTAEKLKEKGAELEIFRGELQVNIEVVKNLIKSNKTISEQSQRVIDEGYEED